MGRVAEVVDFVASGAEGRDHFGEVWISPAGGGDVAVPAAVGAGGLEVDRSAERRAVVAVGQKGFAALRA